MTITDSVGGGSVNGDWNAINNYGTLTVDGGSYSGKVCGLYNEGGTVTINSGTFTGRSYGLETIGDGYWDEDDGQYKFTGTNSSVTINGGTFSASSVTWQGYTVGDGLKIDGNSYVTINGGTFSGGSTALTTNTGNTGYVELDINDGTFNSPALLFQDGSTQLYATITGGTFTSGLETATNFGDVASVSITGGTFNTTNGYAAGYNSGSYTKGAIVIGAVSYNVTIGGDTVVNATGDDVYAIVVEQSNTNSKTKTMITGGTYTSDSYVLYNDVKSADAAIISVLEASGGTFIGAGSKYVTFSGDAECYPNNNGTFTIDKCRVDGGHFHSAELVGSNNDAYYKITGGTFGFADESFNLQTWKSGGKYMVQSGNFIQKNDNGSYTVDSAESTIIEGTVISAVKDDGTYDQMDVETNSFETAVTGVTYRITRTDTNDSKTVDHDFGGTYTGSVVYGLILEGIPVDVAVEITTVE